MITKRSECPLSTREHFGNVASERWVRVAAVAVLATAGTARGDELPAWAAKQTDGGIVRIAVTPPKDPRFAHLAWPKAIRAKDGTIVVAYLAGTSHGGSGCPAVSYSTDGGRT